MSLNDKYFELCYTKRIHEFSKIDLYKNWTNGEAKERYKSLNSFYQDELNIDKDKLIELKSKYKKFNDLYSKYHNKNRKELFENSDKLLTWYDEQKNCCNYCNISQPELHRIVEIRSGNLTLNNKSKRSKGTLEIEKLNPDKGYTYDNSVLCCPLCNNAKSNLISADKWRTYFAPAMKKYYNAILIEDNRE